MILLKRFAAVDWAEKTAGFCWMLCLHCALESSAHFVDAQAHTMGQRRILRMRMSKCSVFLLNWAKPRLYADALPQKPAVLLLVWDL